MPDSVILFIFRVVVFLSQHAWLMSGPALALVFVCAWQVARSASGTPIPGRLCCRACKQERPPSVAPSGAAPPSAAGPIPERHELHVRHELHARHEQHARTPYPTCSECGAPLAKKRSVVHVRTPPRIGWAAAWSVAAIAGGATAALADRPGLMAASTWVATLVSDEAVLAGLRNGDRLAARLACERTQAGFASELPPDQFLQAVQQSLPATDPNTPAGLTWDYFYWVENAWTQSTRRLSLPASSACFSGSVVPSSEESRWLVPDLKILRCGMGAPSETEFAAPRSLRDTPAVQAFGHAIESEPWVLHVPEAGPTRLEWLVAAERLLQLPLLVSGSYDVVVRKGAAPITTGTMLVCRIGPSHFLGDGRSEVWVICNVPRIDPAVLRGGEQILMDLAPNPSARIVMRGRGEFGFGLPHLQCDSRMHRGIPVSVRCSNVPLAMLGGGL